MSHYAYLACARGEERLAEELASRLQEFGVEAYHPGTLSVGGSQFDQAIAALRQGHPIVLCATARAVGSSWCGQIVKAATVNGSAALLIAQMEADAALEAFSLDNKPALYWQDQVGAARQIAHSIRHEAGDFTQITPQIAATRLKHRHALKDVRIVETAHGSNLYRNLGRGAAEYFRDNVQHNYHIGLACATSVFSFVQQLEPFAMRISAYPISLNTTLELTSVLSPYASLLELWHKDPECSPYAAPFPTFFTSPNDRAAHEARPDVQRLLANIRNVNMAFYSCGHFGPSSSYDMAQTYVREYMQREFSPEDFDSLGAAGEINWLPYDSQGNALRHDVADSIGYLTLDDLRRLSADMEHHMVLIAGGLQKIRPLVGALRGRYLNVLVTDHATLMAVEKETR